MTSAPFTRRSMLIGAGAAVLAPAAALIAGPGLARPDPRGVSVAATSTAGESQFSRLRCGSDGGWAVWRYSGVLVLKPEDRLAQSVCRIEGLSFNRMLRDDSGQLLYELDEVGYFCHVDTGQVLETLDNPFTGSSVEPRHYRSPQQTVLSGRRVEPAQDLPPGVDFRGEITVLADIDPVIAMTEDLYVRVRGSAKSRNEPRARDQIFTSLATFTARRNELLDTQRDWVDADLSYTTMNSFTDWLDMTDVEGIQNMRLVGRKAPVGHLETVAGALLDRIQADHPDFLDVPFA